MLVRKLQIEWLSDEPMSDEQLGDVVRLIEAGKIADGDAVSPTLLAHLSSCTHGDGPCAACGSRLN